MYPPFEIIPKDIATSDHRRWPKFSSMPNAGNLGILSPRNHSPISETKGRKLFIKGMSLEYLGKPSSC